MIRPLVMLEQWSASGRQVNVIPDEPVARKGPGEYVVTLPTIALLALSGDAETVRERAMVAAAAPALLRCLLPLEWSANGSSGCPECGATWGDPHGAEPGCALDRALTQAGFPDEDSRRVARKLLGAR